MLLLSRTKLWVLDTLFYERSVLKLTYYTSGGLRTGALRSHGRLSSCAALGSIYPSSFSFRIWP